MKKKKFDEIKVGGHFKYYRSIYIKKDGLSAVDIESGRSIFLPSNVIPVTVTIKVKEK